ncbi:MAG: hypothetical protein B7Z58_18100 [Acidiphilium sp. 37-64-53]|nr:MAG: hypothetical protein B7Z58_18100 [Acidiphilium sp. 37-64-53]
MVRDFAQSLVDQFGIAADVALHAPSAAGDQRNFHAHVLTTTRVVTADGLGAKTRALDARATGPGLVEEIRARWAALCNRALERAGSAARVDHRSYARRAIARIPTLHNGHRVTALARRLGVATARFTENATIREHNARLDALRSIFRAAAAAPPAPATAPMRLTVPGPRLTRPGPRLTLPPTRMEIKNERPTTTQPGSAHQPLLSVPAQSDRSFQLHGQIRAHSASDSGALPQNSRGNFLVPGRPFRRDARDLPPPSELHRIPGKEGAGGGGRPVERDARSLAGVPNLDGGLTRPSDRIADAIAPGRRFQRESADVLDARVAASVAAKIEEYANWLDRVIAADPAVRVARATGDPAQIDAVEKIVRAEKRQKIPDYASILRNAENVYLEKIRKLLDADADFSTAGDGARPSTKPKFPPFGGIP